MCFQMFKRLKYNTWDIGIVLKTSFTLTVRKYCPNSTYKAEIKTIKRSFGPQLLLFKEY